MFIYLIYVKHMIKLIILKYSKSQFMTESEFLLTNINNSVFFKEFTFSQNELRHPSGNTKELADNVVWIDDLLIVYQVKGRERSHIRDTNSEEKWFEKKVETVAKKQVRDTISFFKTYNSLPVKNDRGQEIDIAEAKVHQLIKMIVYDPKSELLDHKRKLKFLESRTVGMIHLFHIDDYAMICKKLVTPSELSEYLEFREEMFLKHKSAIGARREEYLLGHFITTTNTLEINDEYTKNIDKISPLTPSSDVSWILNNFFKNLVTFSGGKETDYHHVIKEIAKLNREELKAFNERYYSAIEQVRKNDFGFPFRFTSSKTGCGFVFIGLQLTQKAYWENALFNFTEIYKYKHKLNRCIGVVVYKDEEYIQINWALLRGSWIYNKILEEYVNSESEYYPKSEINFLPRYPLEP
ncbi:hypothetical protein QE382_002492 [Sphingobacterium zeae]|uniref:Uncharacterized protein n=2 Tax=Sphingobacterium zeae TaxID=1776859 RepID=A0ABU0U8G5_9SPHI|nr:hypothetical protein [Sphingobacterium zeae]